jgi:hypothetical protein
VRTIAWQSPSAISALGVPMPAKPIQDHLNRTLEEILAERGQEAICCKKIIAAFWEWVRHRGYPITRTEMKWLSRVDALATSAGQSQSDHAATLREASYHRGRPALAGDCPQTVVCPVDNDTLAIAGQVQRFPRPDATVAFRDRRPRKRPEGSKKRKRHRPAITGKPRARMPVPVFSASPSRKDQH